MLKKDGQILISVIISLFFFVLLIFVTVSKTSLPILPLIFVLVPFVFLITFLNTDVALIMLIFAMLLSPELEIAPLQQRGAISIRLDDFLIIVAFFSWLAKMAINKELGLLRRTPLNFLIIAYILAYILATGLGIAMHTAQPLTASLFLLKYIEYYMLYFLVANNIRDKKQIKKFVAVLLLTCAIIAIYATRQIGVLPRTTAPFEGGREQAESNTLGGYYVFLFAICLGLFLYSRSAAWQFSSLGLAFLIIPSFLFTLSRGSYLAFIFMYLTLTILTRRKRLLLIGILILSVFILPVILPRVVTQRVEATFVPGKEYEFLGSTRITLDDSAAARVETWGKILKKWKKNPLFGWGASGMGLVETHYPRVLGEAGIIGFLLFIWLMIEIFRYSFRVFNNIEDDWAKGLALGFLAGFIGLLVHAFGASTFIIVRIMEPFWFLTAIVIMLPDIYQNQNIGQKSGV